MSNQTGFIFDSPVTVLGKVMVKNYGQVPYFDLSILDSEGNTIPPGSIQFMLLTELYHDFLLNLKAFSDKWDTMEKITTKVIQIKRIVRLLQLQGRNDPDDTVDDKNLYEEILELPVEVLQMLYINLPRFPETRKEYDEWSSETPNEDSSIDIDATRADIVKKVNMKVNEKEECQQVNKFLQNLALFLWRVIVEKKIVQLDVSEDEIFKKCPSGHFFIQNDHFQKLDEIIKQLNG